MLSITTERVICRLLRQFFFTLCVSLQTSSRNGNLVTICHISNQMEVNMGQMPEAISRVIDSTKEYTNEIMAIENQIAKLQNLLAKFMERPNSENWPRIYMIARCVKRISTRHYPILNAIGLTAGEGCVEHDIEPGKHIRFHYDYETGSFKEDFNFLTQTELFRYEDERDSFDIVAYVTFPNDCTPCWPSGLPWFDSVPNGGKLYIVNFDNIETRNTVRFRYNYKSGEFEEMNDSDPTNR